MRKALLRSLTALFLLLVSWVVAVPQQAYASTIRCSSANFSPTQFNHYLEISASGGPYVSLHASGNGTTVSIDNSGIDGIDITQQTEDALQGPLSNFLGTLCLYDDQLSRVYINGSLVTTFQSNIPDGAWSYVGNWYSNFWTYQGNDFISVKSPAAYVNYDPYVNMPPVVSTLSGGTVSEGSQYSEQGSFTDTQSSSSWTATIDYGDGSGQSSLALNSNKTFSLDHTYTDNGSYTVTVVVTDNQGTTGTKQTSVAVSNAIPALDAITPNANPVQANATTTLTANFSDPGVLDTHTATWNWGDGSTSAGTLTESDGSGLVSNTHTYTAAGVYTINLTVTDKDSGSASSTYQYLSVYDPSAGWASGSKEFTSPTGAVTNNPSAAGTAKFGFQVKYQNGDVVPSGKNVSLTFPPGNIDFSSTSYQWLVVNGTKALFKADGTLNGTSGYTVLVSTIDEGSGNPSGKVRFQIKDSGNSVVYDTQPGASDTADPTLSVTKGTIKVH
jgi:hypothetical protein